MSGAAEAEAASAAAAGPDGATAVASGVSVLHLADGASAASAVAGSPVPAAAASSSSSSAAQWEDITSRLHSAASLLRPGFLLHHSSFSLRESMSSLELGDPKMDASSAVPREVLSVQAALERGLVKPGEKLSLFEQLEVADELMAAEVTYLNGNSMAHTVFTCAYLHRLALLQGCPRLESFLLLSVKSIELVRTVVVQADLHCEEDFYYNLHGLRLGAASIPQNFRNNSTTALAAPSRPSEDDEEQPTEEEQPLYLGRTVTELLANFDREHAAIRARIKELQQQLTATGAAVPAEDSWGPADADSSELHLLSLLDMRFSFRRSWYALHVGLQRPPYLLRANMTSLREHEVAINRALQGMLHSARGSTEREQEALRQENEDAYERSVRSLLLAHAEALRADPAAPTPVFPKKPSPNLPPRELSFGFSHRITSCLVQSAPPRHVSLLHRKDALRALQDFMHHYALLHGLPAVLTTAPGAGAAVGAGSTAVGGGLLELLAWFAQWHRLRPNIVLRSHVWLWVQNAANAAAVPSSSSAAAESDDAAAMAADPCTDLFAWLDPAVPVVPLSPAHPEKVSGQKVAPVPLGGHYNTAELLVRSHVSLCGSIERMALEALEAEAGWRRAPEKRPVWDPATAPMTYAFFLSRTQAPLMNLLRTLLECPPSYRRRTLAGGGGANGGSSFVNDWNILTADARAVDHEAAAGGFWPHLLAEEQLVDVPPSLVSNPAARQAHPNLLYPFNGYGLLLDVTSGFLVSHLLSGLEDGLFQGVKEVPVVLWYLEHVLNLRVQNRGACWRNRGDIIALQKKPPPPPPPAADGGGKKKGGKGPAKITLPPVLRGVAPAWNVSYALAEAQQYICRGLIQMIEGLKLVRMPSSSGAQGDLAIIVPSMPAELASTWYAHRFRDLSFISNPPPLGYAEYVQTISSFARASIPSPSAAQGSEEHIQAVFGMAGKSLQFAKEQLSRASTEIKAAGALAAATAAISAGGNGDPAPSATMSPLSVHGDFVRALLQVTVSNALLPLTYKKSVAAAAANGKRLKLALRWEPQAGTAYTPLHSARLVPFPILQLVQTS